MPAEAPVEESQGWWSPCHHQQVCHIPLGSFGMTGLTPEWGLNCNSLL